MPIDPTQLRFAMLGAIDGADGAARLFARKAADLDGSRAISQARDTERMAAKPGANPATIDAERRRTSAIRAEAQSSTRLAERARVRPLTVEEDRSYVHGRVVTRTGAPVGGLRLSFTVATTGAEAGEASSDERGYFRAALSPNYPEEPLVASVYRGTSVVYRDEQPFRVRTGTSRYREIIVRD